MEVKDIENIPILKIKIESKYKKRVKEDLYFAYKIFRNIVNSYPFIPCKLDLRKASKDFTPLSISCGLCNDNWKINRVKDFTNEDKWCQCGRTKFIEWVYE